MPNRTLTLLRRVEVGHASDPARSTGVTALLFGVAAPTVIDVRGGASCTYDTASLALDATFGRRWGIFFAGGSVYGLDAARGLRTALAERGAGHTTFANPNPVIPITGATLFDLPDEAVELPDYDLIGRAAARAASRVPVPSGRIGAATGASLGKYLGRERATPGALGSAAEATDRGGSIGVLVVLNSVGAVRDPETGRWLAGARSADGRIVPPTERRLRRRSGATPSRGTTLVAVVTDVPVDRPTLQRIAIYAHAGLARVIDPAHTASDGDVVFASCTREPARPLGRNRDGRQGDTLGSYAARLVVVAARTAVEAPLS
ncbi:MAG: P1 family peptidase [Thermoplasmata archaeon]